MTLRPFGVRVFACIVILTATLIGMCLAALFVGVWWPDAIFGSTRTLAEISSAGGQQFRVIQYWNYIDFYSTKLCHTRPDGTIETSTLDGDDFKEWRVPITLNSEHRTVTVTLAGGRIKIITY